MRTRRRFYAALTIAVAGLAAAGCSSSSSSASSSATASSSASAAGSDLSSVTLNVGDQKGTGAEAVLAAAGLLKTLPFKVNWSDFTSGPPMLQAMASGAVDVGGVGDAPPVFAASGGEAIEIVGARKTNNGDQDAVVVPKGSPITSIQQLKGKKIAYASGSSANYNLLTVLNKASLTTKDVSLVNLQPASALAAFTSGSVEAWDVWPPYVQQVVAQNGARVIATGSAYGNPYSFEVASKAAVADPKKAAAIKAYLTILNKGYIWTASHSDQWAAAWAKATGLPVSVMEQAAKLSGTTPVAITDDTTTAEQGLVDQFFAAGLIPTKVDMKDYITDQFNDSVPAG
jgi:sulfonate transport system substrate-binding protein